VAEEVREQTMAGNASLVLLPLVLAGFLRQVTNRRVFANPSSPEEAVAFIDALLASPGIVIREGDVWPLLRSKLLALNLGGNAINDAWIAAAVEAAGEQLVTFDRGFRRLLAARDLILLPA
jgi:hypothetical protein